jgi:hypothetical protein
MLLEDKLSDNTLITLTDKTGEETSEIMNNTDFKLLIHSQLSGLPNSDYHGKLEEMEDSMDSHAQDQVLDQPVLELLLQLAQLALSSRTSTERKLALQLEPAQEWKLPLKFHKLVKTSLIEHTNQETYGTFIAPPAGDDLFKPKLLS